MIDVILAIMSTSGEAQCSRKPCAESSSMVTIWTLMDRGRSCQENGKKTDIGPRRSIHVSRIWRDLGKTASFLLLSGFKNPFNFLHLDYSCCLLVWVTLSWFNLYVVLNKYFCLLWQHEQINKIYFHSFCGKLLNKSGHDLFLTLNTINRLIFWKPYSQALVKTT